MVNLTNRDIDILKALALGVSTFKMLLRLLTKAFECDISETALLRRLSILHRAGYIARRKESYRKRHGNFSIYALTRLSADVLAELGCPKESMRVGLPTTFFVRHELNVTSVLHVIHTATIRDHYKYSFTDSNVLKQYRKKRSRAPIPDLNVIFQLRNRSINMNIEVDLGKVVITKMVRRITEQASREPLVIMCNNETRLTNLRDACSKTYFSGKGNVGFTLLEDFFRNDLHTRYITSTEDTIYLNLDDV